VGVGHIGEYANGARNNLGGQFHHAVDLLPTILDAARGHAPEAMTGNISHETLDIGCDLYTPVSEDYAPPFAFRGTIIDVTVETTPAR
jgi:arylsulfatase A-like enzyme